MLLDVNFRPLIESPWQTNCVVELSREVGLERCSIRPLRAPSSHANRACGPFSARAVRAPATRLGIGLWQVDSWRKKVIVEHSIHTQKSSEVIKLS
jgi:hypothetical protein